MANMRNCRREKKREKKNNRLGVIEKEKRSMGSDAKSNGGRSGGGAGGGGFKSRLEHYLYSGDKKHVMAGIAIISVVFGLPWYLKTRGSMQQSHQDYMEKADKARRERLSSGSASSR